MVRHHVFTQLAIRCQYEADCDDPIRAAVALAADDFEARDVPALADTIFAVSQDAVTADPARPTTLAEVAAARETLRTITEHYPDKLRSDLAATP